MCGHVHVCLFDYAVYPFVTSMHACTRVLVHLFVWVSIHYGSSWAVDHRMSEWWNGSFHEAQMAAEININQRTVSYMPSYEYVRTKVSFSMADDLSISTNVRYKAQRFPSTCAWTKTGLRYDPYVKLCTVNLYECLLGLQQELNQPTWDSGGVGNIREWPLERQE